MTLSDQIQSLSDNTSKVVYALSRWEALHYTGHFIDAHPEMKSRIDEVYEETKDALKAWGFQTLEDQHRRTA